ncbi:MAG: hypothetical protein QOG59_3419 [Solirubrobacteraceae bacterium]|nr:hypothetical protein [Solirubrobacteraceae bacterium]
MARASAPLIPLGYGKYVRADRVFALVPLEGRARGDGRRTLVHIEGLDDPLVASRSESAIARDIALALGRPNPDELVRERIPSDQEALF